MFGGRLAPLFFELNHLHFGRLLQSLLTPELVGIFAGNAYVWSNNPRFPETPQLFCNNLRYPKLEDHILSIDVSTPLSVDFYLKRTAIYGLPHTPERRCRVH